MKRSNHAKSLGFTLIEIVFVLAIAGFIIGLIFLAFPQGKIAAHDAERRTYLQQVASNIDKFKESQANQFQYPSALNFNSNFQPPGGAYAVTTNDTNPGGGGIYNFSVPPIAPSPGTIVYTAGEACNGSTAGNYYSLRIGLESGSTYCLDNH